MTSLSPTTNTQLATSQWEVALQEALQTTIKARPYTAIIRRTTPTAFLLLIDQSGSMGETIVFDQISCTKAEAVARVVNKTLSELINRCVKGHDVYHYYDIALIGYGAAEKARLLWDGELAGKTFVSPNELAQHPKGYTDTAVEKTIRGRLVQSVEKRPYWLEPVAAGRTPMKSAFETAETLLHQWLVNHRGLDCYPPTILNITDGAATDATENELLQTANRLRQLHTADGHVLVLNVHLSGAAGTPTLFPRHTNDLPNNNYARLLYDLSSEMPARYHADIASLRREDMSQQYVGMSFNADVEALVKFMDIGTPTDGNKGSDDLPQSIA